MQQLYILIIGGSGFVSGTLAQTALAQGHRVWTITRGQRLVPDGAISMVADRHETDSFERVVSGANVNWDMVVDCIGYEPDDARHDIAVFHNKAKQLVFVSTDFVFDPCYRKFPQLEESDHYLADGYGGKKRLCELELLKSDCGEMQWTVFRPCHIYGPGSELGCLPRHGRDPQLVSRLASGDALALAGGGHFLQQPIFAKDLAELILSAAGEARSYREIFCTSGPDIVESREYYRIIAEILGVGLRVEEIPVSQHLTEHPESAPFLCHRIYSLDKLRSAGLKVPATSIADGLREHVTSLARGANAIT